MDFRENRGGNADFFQRNENQLLHRLLEGPRSSPTYSSPQNTLSGLKSTRPSPDSPRSAPNIGSLCLLATQAEPGTPQASRLETPARSRSSSERGTVGVRGAEQSPASTSGVGDEGEKRLQGGGGRALRAVEVGHPRSLRLVCQPQPRLAIPLLPVTSSTHRTSSSFRLALSVVSCP